MTTRKMFTRTHRYKVLHVEDNKADVGFMVFTGLITIGVLCSSFALLSMSVVNHELVRNIWKCTMDNCVNTASFCEVKTCSPTGQCISLGSYDGCIEPGINVSAQVPTANYAFDTICFSELTPCQSQSNQNAMLSYATHYSAVQSDESILYLNGNINITGISYLVGDTNVTSFNFDGWVEDNPDVILDDSGSTVPTTLRKLGDFVVYNFDDWNATVTNGYLLSLNGTVSSDDLPFDPHGNSTLRFPILLSYNGNDLPGMITIDYLGSFKWYWLNTTSMILQGIFNCNCTFYSTNILYFS